jgi:hypothetical protein
MSKTIETTFDPKSLPRWAQNNPAVVARCERDLAFRVNVINAQTRQYRELLKRDAAR